MPPLFSDHYLASIAQFSLAVRPAAPRAAQGTQLSPRAGASLEFRDYQGYTAGDDLRRVDWNVYARTKHLFVRRFEHPTVVPMVILIDASASMCLEQPSRYATASRVAVALASAALASQNPVQYVIAGEGAAVGQTIRQRRGLVRMLGELSADRPASAIGLGDSLRAIQPLLAKTGPGVLAVVSDFFEPQGVHELTAALGRISQRLVLVRVTQPWDADPHLTGDFDLVDCETEASLQVSMRPDALRGYREAYNSYFAELDAFTQSRGATAVTVDASSETLPQLQRLFPDGVLRL